MNRNCSFGLLLLLFLFPTDLVCQQSCPALPIPKIVPGNNIFTEAQEAYLGDVQAVGLERWLTVIPDPALTAYLQEIVDRLAQGLPPNHIQFRVKLVDVSTADCFSIVGGRIYVSRKIVAVTRSEDELAGLLAHEMGHIAAHHEAIEMSTAFRQVLGVTSVGDRDDVSAKWNQLLSNYARRKTTSGDYEKSLQLDDREQAQADAIALYLTTRAGYSPQAFEAFFDRLAQTKGKATGFWADFFLTSTPDTKRLRQIIKNTPTMPASCVASRSDTHVKYEDWKKGVMEVSALDVSHKESLPGLISKRVLRQRLRPEIQNIQVSANGKYVLAEDDSNVFVLTRQPLAHLFRIDAPDPTSVQFTPDASGLVVLFADSGASPRVERWNIGTHARTEVHEIYVRDGCLRAMVSSDGKTLACLTLDSDSAGFMKFDLDLFDVAAGASFFHKRGWASFDVYRLYWLLDLDMLVNVENEIERLVDDLAPMAFSPDGHYFVAHTFQNTMAMDLPSRSSIELPGAVKGVLADRFVFLGNDRLLGTTGLKGEKATVVEFPGGKVLYRDLNLGNSQPYAVARGEYVVLRPIKDHAAGVFDMKQNRIVLASKRGALDLWDDTCVSERQDGDLQIVQLPSLQSLDHTQLPDAPLGKLRADAMSTDLSWLAVSQSARGAVWNLQNGERVYHLRGFSAAYFAPDGNLYADFPKYLSTDRVIARASLTTSGLSVQKTLADKQRIVQVGSFLLKFSPAKPDNTRRDVTLELSNIVDGKILWSKHFPHERPGYHVDVRANSIALYWQAGSQSAKSIAKDDPAAATALARYKDKDGTLFVQVFELDTGKLRAQVAIDTGKHSFQIVEAVASTDRLIIADNEDRVLVYAFDGQLKGTIAGRRPEISPNADLLTVRTERGELELYDLTNVQKRNTYDFDSRVACDGFSGDGKRLLVLTTDQVVYLLDVAAKQTDNSVAAK